MRQTQHCATNLHRRQARRRVHRSGRHLKKRGSKKNDAVGAAREGAPPPGDAAAWPIARAQEADEASKLRR